MAGLGGGVVSVAAIDSRAATALLVAGGLAIFGAMLVATAAGELAGRRKAKVPSGFRPAPSDEELERRVIERYLIWGALTTLLMALWLPAYWLREPTREGEKKTAFLNLAIKEGRKLYVGDEATPGLCAQCHGVNGEGLPRQVTIEGRATTYTEPPLRHIYSRYKAAGRNEDEITQLIYDAVNRGRPGTPMPTWSLAFGGPLNSAQVDDVVAFIRSIQEVFPAAPSGASGAEIFKANCAVCHGPNGAGVDADGNNTPGPNLTVALQRLTAQQLRTTILNGRLNTNRFSMPAWAALGNEAIDALVRFIQSIQRSA